MNNNLVLTRDERAKVEFAATQWTEKYYPPIPADCPPSIRVRIVAERCRRLGALEIQQALLAPVSDRRPTPAPVTAPSAAALDDLDRDARLLAGI